MNVTKWNLIINPNSTRYKGCAACYLQRDINDSDPEQLELDHELSFLGSDGLSLLSETFLKNIYRKGEFKEGLHAKKDEIFSLKKELFIPYGHLTIRCRIWDSQKLFTQSVSYFAETCIEIKCTTFIGIIKKFSSTTPTCKNLICIKSPSTVTVFSSMNLCVTNYGKLFIEIKLVNRKTCTYNYKIFIQDVIGNKAKAGYREFHENDPHNIPLTLLKEYIMENKKDYLSNDMLTIECEVTFPTGVITEKIEEQESGFDLQVTPKMISNAMETNFSSKEYHFKNFTTLKSDFSLLLNEGVLCDTKLKTATETFPAHIAVLGARSPVFKSMFTNEMKEKTNKCVEIDD